MSHSWGAHYFRQPSRHALPGWIIKDNKVENGAGANTGNVDIVDVPEPPCPDDQVRVQVAFCGVCGTDIHVLHDTFRSYPPVILGHEFSGTVIEIGRNVRGVWERESQDWEPRRSHADGASTA